MFVRSIVLRSFLSLSVAAPLFAVGCAAPTDSPEDAEEQLAETQDELTAAGTQLVGSYYSHAAVSAGFARLDLQANGKYSAQRDGGGTIACITSPCLVPESGTWNASKKPGGGFRLRVTAKGQGSRYYDAAKTSGPSTLTLSRAGVTETLNKLGATQCLDSSDCKATEDCAPRMCLMYCAANDPFCCGPSHCTPKAPPPPACTGAWLDEHGGCRGLADEGLPATCCAGLSTPCGAGSCSVGESCCNPLAAICTKPGFACAM